MSKQTEIFVENLTRRFPTLQESFQSHVADNDEILPHVFMGDVTRYVLANGSDRQRLVEHLAENLCHGDKEVQDLIAVSFVENLEDEIELERALEGAKADSLRTEWRRQQCGRRD